jgi:hypothetical protein
MSEVQGKPYVRPLEWVGSSLVDLKKLPRGV